MILALGDHPKKSLFSRKVSPPGGRIKCGLQLGGRSDQSRTLMEGEPLCVCVCDSLRLLKWVATLFHSPQRP